jgi:transposase
MRPYSQDLRQRIVDTVQRGEGTIHQVAERFLVSVSFVTRLLQLYRTNGSVEPRPHGGGNPAVLTPHDLERLGAFLRKRPDATLQECATHLGSSCSLMTLSRALKNLGLPR